MANPYIPHKLPLKNLDWARFVTQIGRANAEIARFDSLLQTIPNAQILLSPMTMNEAVLSSKIEGTKATLQEVYEYEANPNKYPDKIDDIQEVLNYRNAILFAIKELEKIPISARLVKGIHKILLSGSRGANKNPGSFRTGQVHIGSSQKIEEAVFIPPEAHTIPEHFSNLEKYFHYDDKDFLVQLAIIHAQFEIIHPFWDGNGRVGRILLPLFLFYKKMLHSPNFYLSEYFETHRQDYYIRLNGISKTDDWESWIDYFLNAVIEQSKINIVKAQNIIMLYNKMKESISSIPGSKYAITVLDFIFSQPIFSSEDFIGVTKINKPSTARILNYLCSQKILRDDGRQRYRTYFFTDLLRIIS